MDNIAMETAVPVFWSYETKALQGICRIDGAAMTAIFRVSRRRPERFVNTVPDVRLIDDVFAKRLEIPCIVEELLSFAEAMFPPPEWECEVIGETCSHGKLVVRNT